jgi:hypothetical protein
MNFGVKKFIAENGQKKVLMFECHNFVNCISLGAITFEVYFQEGNSRSYCYFPMFIYFNFLEKKFVLTMSKVA